MKNKNNMNRIVPYLLAALALFAPTIASAQDAGVPAMDPFCAEHFAGTHTHGRRCAVCEEEMKARCEQVDGKIDACPCGHFLDPKNAIDPASLDEGGKVLFEECVRYGYLALPAETADVNRPPIDKSAVLAALDAAIKTREELIKAEERLGRDVAALKAELADLKATRATAARDVSKIDVAALLKKIPVAPPKRPVQGPNLAEGAGTVASGGVIGAGVGATVGLVSTKVTVLAGASLGGPIGLGIGLGVVIVWAIVSD